MDDELNPHTQPSLPSTDTWNYTFTQRDFQPPSSYDEALLNYAEKSGQDLATAQQRFQQSGLTLDTFDAAKGLLQKFGSGILGMFKRGGSGADKDEIDWKKVATVGGGLMSLFGGQSRNEPPKTGYQGSIPKYEAIRSSVANATGTTRVPGSGGQRYFSDVRYATEADAPTARQATAAQAKELEAANLSNSESYPIRTQKAAAGGVMGLAKGRYLNGPTDGMADKIQTTIAGKDPAALSHGEFVIPADVVSHLGNGNSEAGAQRLYDMMDRIRKARTGSPKQGKQINANRYLPA
jgi:hypothetical protein